MYAQPLEVLDQIDHTENRSESFSSVSQGSEKELEETYLIENAFTVSGNDQDVVIKEGGEGGTTASTSDYEVDLRDGSFTWNGTDGVDLYIRYKTGPVPNEVVKNEIESATDAIDDYTNTTFNGTETVTETYNIDERGQRELVLYNRPVQSISQVRVNEARVGDSDDFRELDSGRSNDYYQQDELSVAFVGENIPPQGRAVLEIEYTYGYSDIPNEINKVCRMMAAQSLFQNNIAGEGVDGRDDYDPRLGGDFINDKEDILDSWRIQRMGEPVPVNL